MKESKAEFQKALDCMLFEGVDSCWAELFLQQNGQSRCFAKGEEIYSPAHYSKSLGILLRGKAVVERDQVLLNQLSAGECFGVAALFVQREQYVTTVRARTDCKVLFLSLEAMQRLLENPQVSLNYIRFLSDRIQFLNRRLPALPHPMPSRRCCPSFVSSRSSGVKGCRWLSSPRCSTSAGPRCTAWCSSWNRTE